MRYPEICKSRLGVAEMIPVVVRINLRLEPAIFGGADDAAAMTKWFIGREGL